MYIPLAIHVRNVIGIYHEDVEVTATLIYVFILLSMMMIYCWRRGKKIFGWHLYLNWTVFNKSPQH